MGRLRPERCADHGLDAGAREDLRLVFDRDKLAGLRRRHPDRTKQHVRNADIDTKDRAAVDLGGGVETFEILTDETPFRRRLQLRGRVQWKLCGITGEVTISDRTAGLQVCNPSVFRLALGRADASRAAAA